MSDSANSASPISAPAAAPMPKSSARKRGLSIVGLTVLVGLMGYMGYQWLVGSRVEVTDNAYVNADVVQITPLVGGTVRAVHVDDTDFVKAGQTLVSLDPADTRVALEQAQSALAQTVREVRTLYANNGTLQAQVRARDADVQRAKASWPA